jgi:hypothetical protein
LAWVRLELARWLQIGRARSGRTFEGKAQNSNRGDDAMKAKKAKTAKRSKKLSGGARLKEVKPLLKPLNPQPLPPLKAF